MKVSIMASATMGLLVLVAALIGVLLKAAEPCWHPVAIFLGGGDKCIPPNAYLAMALIAVGVIPFFGFLGFGNEPEDMRTAIAVALVTVNVVLLGDVAFFSYHTESLKLDPLAKRMITSFTTTVGIIIPFYFGASAYAQRNEIERERDELRRDLEDHRASQSGRTRASGGAAAGEGPEGQQEAT
jgi:hypothetical protein